MLTKKEFQYLCEETTTIIKQLKSNNDKIYKGVGVEAPEVLSANLEAQNNSHNFLTKKVESIIKNLEKNYLDPDSARKIGAIKQQLSIQNDRRGSIVREIEAEFKQTLKNKSVPLEYSLQSYKLEEESHEKSNTSEQTQQTRRVVIQDFDFEIQHQLAAQRHRHLNQVEESFNSIHGIAQQTLKMTLQQGENLTLISDSLIKSHKNTKSANQELMLAHKYQRKAGRKYVWCTLIILVIVAVIVCLIAI